MRPEASADPAEWSMDDLSYQLEVAGLKGKLVCMCGCMYVLCDMYVYMYYVWKQVQILQS
jgi:hypothetical protein